MSESSASERAGIITGMLRDAAQGNKEAFDRLLPHVYEELRELAHAKLRLERSGHTLNTTGLVHEAYLRLVGQTRVEWKNRSHFFAVASEAMRRILVDYAKQRQAAKRGGGAVHLPLDAAGNVAAASLFSNAEAEDLIALDDALHRLHGFNPQGARIVQYRFFGGMAEAEVAEVLGVSERTVRRSWTVARAWLKRELGELAIGY
ncbi:MAG: sigma-70 family RNA polymerase sigma factor [Gemmatimonadales bacterium]